MKKKSLSAVGAERLLIIGVVLLIGLMFADIYFMNGFLSGKSKDAVHAKIDADISDTDIENMTAAGKKLETYDDVVTQVDKIIADSKSYQYQNQIISDLQSYAARTGLKISGFTFSVAAASTGAAATPPSSGSSSSSTTPAAGAGASSSEPKGVKSVQATINFSGDVPYSSLLKFIVLIEQNVTRMQIVDLSLAPKDEDRNIITSPTMTLKVYTKE